MAKAIEILGDILFIFTIQIFQARPLNTLIANESSTLMKLLVLTTFQSDVAPRGHENEEVAAHEIQIQSS